MMLWRTFRDNGGRLHRWNQDKFWQLTRTNVDPVIPNYPLETPAGPGTIYYQTVAGSLSFAGGITKKTAHFFSATPLPFTGGLTKKTSKQLAGSLSFTGLVTKKTMKLLDGTLLFAGSLFWRLLRSLTAGLTFVGVLSTVYIPGTGGGIKRSKKRKSFFALPEEVYQWLM